MRVLLLGPPGAGKGTQAARLASRRGAAHVATGDLLREAISEGTPLGQKAKEYMNRGDYVPDQIVIDIVREWLACVGDAGFVLDGFPRTRVQAEALDDMLADFRMPLQAVVHMDVPDEELVTRLSGRRTCPTCQRAYHLTYNQPRFDEMCDDDGTPLVSRSDDAPDTVRHRLKIYYDATADLTAYYARIARTVDGVGPIEKVAARIDRALTGIT